VASASVSGLVAGSPLANPTTGTRTPAARAFDLAAGMLKREDSRDRLVLVHVGQPGAFGTANLFLSAYELSAQGLEQISQVALGEARGDADVAVAVGYFTAALHQDGIGVAWSDRSGKLQVDTWLLADAGLARKGNVAFAWGQSYGALALCAGDLNIDGVEELVVGVQSSVAPTYDSTVTLRILVTDNELTPGLATPEASVAHAYGSLDASLCDYGLELRIGTLQGGVASSIVLSGLGQKFGIVALGNTYRHTTALVQVDPQLQFPLGYRDKASPSALKNVLAEDDVLALDPADLSFQAVLADTSGATIRVGPPEARVATSKSVIAVINFPPVHYGVNGPDDIASASIAFIRSGETIVTLGLDTQSTYTTSDMLSANMTVDAMASIRRSIHQTYGDHFSHVTQDVSSMTVAVSSSSSHSDAILVAEMICNVWQYPVYAAGKTDVRGYLLVIFPAQTPTTGVIWGNDPAALYAPGHVVGNLASYATYATGQATNPQSNPGGPGDYDPSAGSFSNMFVDVGGGQTSATFTWANQSSDTVQRSHEQTLSVTTSIDVYKSFEFLEGFSLGLGVDFSTDDTYTKSNTSLHEIQYQQSTIIELTYSELADAPAKNQTYQVVPYVYWSTKGGYLKVDYTVLYSADSWYTQQFQKPCVGFNMPWLHAASDAPKSPIRLLTRDISFSPGLAPAGPAVQNPGVTVTATVRNHGLAPSSNVSVQFYCGTAAKPTAIGAPIVLGVIAAQSAKLATVDWEPPATLPPDGIQVWCVVDPEQTRKDLKSFDDVQPEDDTATTAKIAYNRWPTSVFSA
jgi:hypothetical protein